MSKTFDESSPSIFEIISNKKSGFSDEELLNLVKELEVDQLNHEDEYKNTILSIATEHNKYDIVEYLLSLPDGVININHKNTDQDTPLIIAIDNSHYKLAKSILSHPNVDVNAQGMFGNTPLHLAVIYNSDDFCLSKALLEHPKINFNIADIDNNIPLINALALNANFETIKTLIEHSIFDYDTISNHIRKHKYHEKINLLIKNMQNQI